MNSKLIFIFIFLFYFSNISFVKANETCFIITAYYSPLPNQNHYFKWDYFSEIRLNWNWIRWASWKPVFSWMLRAPKNYEFWTKIFIPWLWVWEVSDRWWAIVAKDAENSRWYDYDRLDIWMWHWEKWLARALTWWKKKVCWVKIMPSNSKITIDIDKIPRNLWVLNNLNKPKIDIFAIDIWPKSPVEHTEKLHEYLKSIWLYNWKIKTSYNKDTIIAVYNFQLKNWIVKNPKNNWAWIWWEQTRHKAKQIEDEKNKLLAKNNLNDEELYHPVLSKNLTPYSSSDDIKELQDFFKYLWFYSWEINWKFDDIKDVLIDYQIKNNIIKSRDYDWAWYFWPKTRKVAIKHFLKKKEQEKKIALIKENIDKKVSIIFNNIWSPKRWEIWENVRILQKLLSTLWYFKVKDSAIFWQITTDAIISYQIDKKIIKSKNDYWAWYFWPKTKESLKKDLYELLIKKSLNNVDLLVYKN